MFKPYDIKVQDIEGSKCHFSIRYHMLRRGNKNRRLPSTTTLSDLQELGADVEVRHPQTGSVLGFLSNSQVKRSKPLQVGEDIEVEPWNHGMIVRDCTMWIKTSSFSLSLTIFSPMKWNCKIVWVQSPGNGAGDDSWHRRGEVQALLVHDANAPRVLSPGP